MIIVYRLLINLVILFSPIIILVRLIKRKEHLTRFKEKFTFFSKRKINGKLIWFHTVSVGELLSILPLIKELEKIKDINQILITSTTLSSAKLFEKFNFKKTIHQFFPIDNNYLTKKFLTFWKPSLAVFIDSEIWPNMLLNLREKSIPRILLNARITKRSFKKWKKLGLFSRKLFQSFDFTYPQNIETKKYLKKFNVKKIKTLGNLKFSQNNFNMNNIRSDTKKFFEKKKLWCASSTHPGEELICVQIHQKLKLKYKNLVTVIIPRHVQRSYDLAKQFEQLGINVYLHSSKKKIEEKTQIYIVDTYGETESFFDICKIVFLGKSLTSDGGQNPLEPARHNCRVLYGPRIYNFIEIYAFLKKQNIAFKVNNKNQLLRKIDELLGKNFNAKNTKNKINVLGKNILKKTLIELKSFY
jgi:3-deoxy-D-manno-octulosonic-acid transferase